MTPISRLLLVVGLLVVPALGTRAGLTSNSVYTERTETDFDTFLQALNPYGTWFKSGDKWAYTPADHQVPYTHGRWVYTEYGWYWKGTLPHSWATEHYGYWKRGTDGVWSWFPGAFWLPEIVEVRQTSSYIGWRSAEVDESGVFAEEPLDRYTKTGEWTFVTRQQFANSIEPGLLAAPDVVKTQLEESTDCRHVYLTYRPIDRPGPHPADLAPLSKDGGMLAPLTVRDEALALAASQAPATNAAAPNAPASANDDVPKPQLLGQEETDAKVDQRKVKYWVTMSLPNFWSRPPDDAKPDELYLYRPDLYQDQDGIERRITLWFNPNARTSLKEALGQTEPSAATPDSAAPVPAGAPAEPVGATPPARDPFASPLDSRFQASGGGSSTNGAPRAPAPTGLRSGK